MKFVFNQKIDTCLRWHRNAFEHFGGLPKRLVTGSLKAGIGKRFWDEPEELHAYWENAEHYGFLIDLCKSGKP